MRGLFPSGVAALLVCSCWMCEQQATTLFAARGLPQTANPSPPARSAPPQALSSLEQVSAIEKSCGAIQARANATKPNLLIGRNDPDDGTPGPWQAFASQDDLDKAADVAHFEDQVWVWEESGNVLHVELALPTEDWMTVANYCFRADGTVAEINSDLENFTYNLIARREWVFNTKGRVLKFTQQFLDLQTGKPKKPDDEFFEVDVDTPRYLKVSDLPFAALLHKTAARP